MKKKNNSNLRLCQPACLGWLSCRRSGQKRSGTKALQFESIPKARRGTSPPTAPGSALMLFPKLGLEMLPFTARRARILRF
jgi:hypothetical protein